MKTRFTVLYILWFLLSASSSLAVDPFTINSYDGGLSVYANIYYYNGENTISEKLVNNQNISANVYNSPVYAYAQEFNNLSTTGGQINFTFNASTQLSGGPTSNGNSSYAGATVTLNFNISVAMYCNFGSNADVTNVGTYVELLKEDYASETLLGYCGNNPNLPSTQENGSFQGLLQPGSYTVRTVVSPGFPTASSTGSFLGSYSGWLNITPGPLPSVTTDPALKTFGTSDTLKGTVNPNGQPATAWFEFGRTTAYELPAIPVSLNLNNSTSPQSLSADVSGLSPGATYHYRMVAEGTNGPTAVYGQDMQFVTGNNGTIFQFSSANYSGSAIAPSVTITVNCIGGTYADFATITYATSDGTAKANVDYIPHSDTLIWAQGEDQSETFTVQLLHPVGASGNPKTVLLTLSDPSEATLGSPTQAVLTITVDGNPAPQTPVIGSITAISGGGVHLQCVGTPNTTCQIEASPDLSSNSFAPLATVTADAGGAFHYNDLTTAKQRFYHIVYPASGATGTTSKLKPQKMPLANH